MTARRIAAMIAAKAQTLVHDPRVEARLGTALLPRSEAKIAELARRATAGEKREARGLSSVSIFHDGDPELPERPPPGQLGGDVGFVGQTLGHDFVPTAIVERND